MDLNNRGASERDDNGATDPCRLLEGATRLLPLCFLSGGLSAGGGGEQHAYRTVPAWRRSCGPMSAPEGPKPLVLLEHKHAEERWWR